MGLDWYVVKTKKGMKHPSDWSDVTKLYYLRKPYALVSYLRGSYDDYFSPIDEKDWNSLMEITDKLFEKYDEEDLYSALYTYENDDLDLLTDDQKKMVAYYHQWYDRHFDTEPYFGYAHSVCVLDDLHKLNPKVQEIFADPDVDLYQVVDY